MRNVAAEKLTPERRRQLTRDALVDAAAEVFAQKGVSGASMEEIAAEAGFSRGAIYSNFGSKEELLLVVMDRFMDRQLVNFSEGVVVDADDLVGGAVSAGAVFKRMPLATICSSMNRAIFSPVRRSASARRCRT